MKFLVGQSGHGAGIDELDDFLTLDVSLSLLSSLRQLFSQSGGEKVVNDPVTLAPEILDYCAIKQCIRTNSNEMGIH